MNLEESTVHLTSHQIELSFCFFDPKGVFTPSFEVIFVLAGMCSVGTIVMIIRRKSLKLNRVPK